MITGLALSRDFFFSFSSHLRNWNSFTMLNFGSGTRQRSRSSWSDLDLGPGPARWSIIPSCEGDVRQAQGHSGGLTSCHSATCLDGLKSLRGEHWRHVFPGQTVVVMFRESWVQWIPGWNNGFDYLWFFIRWRLRRPPGWSITRSRWACHVLHGLRCSAPSESYREVATLKAKRSQSF